MYGHDGSPDRPACESQSNQSVDPDRRQGDQREQREGHEPDGRRRRPPSQDVDPGVDLRDLERADERAEEPIHGGRTLTVGRIQLTPVAVHQDGVCREQEDLDVPAKQRLEIRRPEQDRAGDDRPEPQSASREIGHPDQEDSPGDGHHGSRQEGQRRDDRQDERRVEERQIGTAGRRERACRVGVATRQPSLGGTERDLEVDADRVSGEQPLDVVRDDQGEDRRQDDGHGVVEDGATGNHARKYVRRPGAADTMRWMSVDVRKTYVAAVPLPVRRALRDGAVIAGLLFFGIPVRHRRAGRRNGRVRRLRLLERQPRRPLRGPPSAGSARSTTRRRSPGCSGRSELLEWPSFLWLWLALLFGNIVWLGGRGVRILWILAFPPVALELYHGNIHLWIAAAIALGFRYPWTWGFVLLTKVTPGVGLLWFALRREWRALGIALGVTGRHRRGVARAPGPAVGRLAGVHRLDAGRRLGGPVPDRRSRSWIRLPAAVVLVAWGALTDRRWTVPVAATLALPVLWVSGFAICAALASTSLWPRPDAPVSPAELT